MRRLFFALVVSAVYASSAYADLAVTPGSGATILTKQDGGGKLAPSHTVCDATAPGTCGPVSATIGVGVNLLDGSDVTLGAKADAKSTATDGTAITLMSVAKQISASVQAAASSLATAVTSLGTLIINTTAIATSAKQDTSNAALGAPADSTCSTGTASCTLTALVKYLNTKLDAAVSSLSTIAANTGAAIPTGSNTIGALTANQSVNVTLVGGGAVPSLGTGIQGTTPAPTSTAAAGIAPAVDGSAVSSKVLKAGAGNLYSVYATCSAACWLMVFNSTTAPSNGATTAGVASGNMQHCVPIAANDARSISYSGMPPEVFTVGMTAVISSTACATLTLATTGFIHGSVQ